MAMENFKLVRTRRWISKHDITIAVAVLMMNFLMCIVVLVLQLTTDIPLD